MGWRKKKGKDTEERALGAEKMLRGQAHPVQACTDNGTEKYQGRAMARWRNIYWACVRPWVLSATLRKGRWGGEQPIPLQNPF